MLSARVQRTLDRRGLLPRGATVLIACSGGPDSGALLHVLASMHRERGWRLHAASVDHGIRPGAAADVAVAARQALEVGVPFCGLQADVESGPSLQSQARAARYRVLAAEAARVGARRIAVGHTRDDQAETVLSRLLRGSGVKGLGGVAPLRSDGVVRPLIDCRRGDVAAYVRRHGIECCDDPSNRDSRFERVRLRRLLPSLVDESPRLVDHLAELADECRDTAAWVDATAAELDLGGGPELDPAPLRALPPPLRRAALAAWLRTLTGAPARRAHLRSLEEALEAGRGEVLVGSGWRVCCGSQWVAHHDPTFPSRSHRSPRGHGKAS